MDHEKVGRRMSGLGGEIQSIAFVHMECGAHHERGLMEGAWHTHGARGRKGPCTLWSYVVTCRPHAT